MKIENDKMKELFRKSTAGLTSVKALLVNNPYDSAGTSEKIITEFDKVILDGILKKTFYDIKPPSVSEY